jgi:PEGA domain
MRVAPVLAVVLASCGGATPRATAERPRGVLFVACPVADAVLVVDEESLGELRALPGGVSVTAGHHRVELRHDRYHTRYAEVDVLAGQRRTLELTLAEALP